MREMQRKAKDAGDSLSSSQLQSLIVGRISALLEPGILQAV